MSWKSVEWEAIWRGYQKFPNIQHGDAMETTAVAGMVSEAKLILQGWKMKVNRKKPVEVSWQQKAKGKGSKQKSLNSIAALQYSLVQMRKNDETCHIIQDLRRRNQKFCPGANPNCSFNARHPPKIHPKQRNCLRCVPDHGRRVDALEVGVLFLGGCNAWFSTIKRTFEEICVVWAWKVKLFAQCHFGLKFFFQGSRLPFITIYIYSFILGCHVVLEIEMQDHTH